MVEDYTCYIGNIIFLQFGVNFDHLLTNGLSLAVLYLKRVKWVKSRTIAKRGKVKWFEQVEIRPPSLFLMHTTS